MKTCTNCLIEKDIIHFSKFKNLTPVKKKTKWSAWCKLCVNTKTNEWRVKNWEKYCLAQRKSSKKYGMRLRAEIVEAYGSVCNCCGEKELMFLELDHVKNDGYEERKKPEGRGLRLYISIKRLGFPKDRYQLLCSNCNQGKKRNSGICPHMTSVMP